MTAQHPDDQLRIDWRPSCAPIEIVQMAPEFCQIEIAIDRAQQVVLPAGALYIESMYPDSMGKQPPHRWGGMEMQTLAFSGQLLRQPQRRPMQQIRNALERNTKACAGRTNKK